MHRLLPVVTAHRMGLLSINGKFVARAFLRREDGITKADVRFTRRTLPPVTIPLGDIKVCRLGDMDAMELTDLYWNAFFESAEEPAYSNGGVMSIGGIEDFWVITLPNGEQAILVRNPEGIPVSLGAPSSRLMSVIEYTFSQEDAA